MDGVKLQYIHNHDTVHMPYVKKYIVNPWLVFHYGAVLFLLFNVVFNYVMCVFTRTGHVMNDNFRSVVLQLSKVTNYEYPTDARQARERRKDYAERMIERRRAREENLDGTPVVTEASVTDDDDTTPLASPSFRPNWMLQGPTEWGWCAHTNQPKPPRSHFDYVTNTLVLNMDHYCPWVFNCVGYFNYRYFVNFLLYVELAMVYIFFFSWKPFINMSSSEYNRQIKICYDLNQSEPTHIIPNVPTPHERSTVGFMFMMSVAVGFSVGLLFCFHIGLILTGQTTIEFNATFARRRHLATKKKSLVSPYDIGWKQNFRQVYGNGNIFLSLLPSTRAPTFLPIPFVGEEGVIALPSTQLSCFGCNTFSATSQQNVSSIKSTETDRTVGLNYGDEENQQ